MSKKNCLLFGISYKLFSYKGDICIHTEKNVTVNFSDTEYFFIEIDNNLIPFFIEKIKETNKNITIKFQDINCEVKAKKLIDKKIYVLKKWAKYHTQVDDELFGFKVVDNILGELGKVDFITNSNLQKLVYVKNKKSEFCFPMHSEFIKEINKSTKIIIVEIPEEITKLN